MPWPWGKRAPTEALPSSNRIPRNAQPSVSRNTTPSSRSAATASGKRPSPHAFVMGGLAPSATITRKPLVRAAIAAASPAGPPPTTNTSVSHTMYPPLLQKRAFLHRSEGLRTYGISMEPGGQGSFQSVQSPDRTTVCSHSARDVAAMVLSNPILMIAALKTSTCALVNRQNGRTKTNVRRPCSCRHLRSGPKIDPRSGM